MNETGIKRLGNLGQFIRGSGISKADIVSNGGLPSIRYGEIYTKYGEVITKLVSQVSISGAQSALRLKIGDILFPTSGETAEDIGKAVTYIGETEAYAGSDIMALRDHGENPIYLAHALNTWEANRQKFRLAEGGPIVHIYVSEFAQLSVWLPSLPEQQKIAEILSDCDAAIKQTKLKIDLFNKEFLAIGSNLFSHKKSTIKLERAELGKLADIKKGEQLNRSKLSDIGQFPVYSGGINPSGYFHKHNMPKNTVTISEGGNSCGYVRFIKTPFWSGGHCYSILPVSGILNPYLLYFALKFRQRDIMRLRVGTGLPNIQYSDLAKLEIWLPLDGDQQKILNICHALEEQIIKISEQLNFLKQQKHGLMQQLLTGKLYVKGIT